MGGRQHRPSRTRTPTAPPWVHFVGRERELGGAQNCPDRGAIGGRGGFVVWVAGEPGYRQDRSSSASSPRRLPPAAARAVLGRRRESGGAPPVLALGPDRRRALPGTGIEEVAGGDRLGSAALACSARWRRSSNERKNGSEATRRRHRSPSRHGSRMLDSLAAFLRAAQSRTSRSSWRLTTIDAAGADAVLALEFVSRELREVPCLRLLTLQARGQPLLRPETEPLVPNRSDAHLPEDRPFWPCPRSDLALMLEQMTGAAPAQELVRRRERARSREPLLCRRGRSERSPRRVESTRGGGVVAGLGLPSSVGSARRDLLAAPRPFRRMRSSCWRQRR